MIYLILSIVVSSFFVLSFKYFERYKIDNFHAAAVNYIVAAVIGLIINHDRVDIVSMHQQEWTPIAYILGFTFICMINVIAVTTQKNGISVASVATKTSLIIPVSLGFFLYNDQPGILKIGGIVLALVSVFLVSKKEEAAGSSQKKQYLLPVILFFATGSADSLVKYAQVTCVKPEETGLFITTLFAVAGLIGIIVVGFQVFFQRKKFQARSLVGGLCLGVINYGTMYFLIKALETKSFESSFVFPVNNMGIVIFSALCGYIIFKEKISKINMLGVLISIVAISLIAFS